MNPQNHKTEITLLLITFILFFISTGMNIVLFPALLISQGVSETGIAFSFTIEQIAGILITLKIATFTRKLGTFSVLRAFFVVYASFLIILPLYHSYNLWLLLMFGFGISLFGINITLNAVYNQFLNNKTRGKYMSIATIAICIGLSLGPLLVKWGASGHLGFIISGGIMVLALIPTLFLSKSAHKVPQARSVKLAYFIKRAPFPFLARYTQDIIITAIFVLGVVYLAANQYDIKTAGLIVTAFSMSAIMNYPIGLLVDRYNNYWTTIIGFSGIALSMIGVILGIHSLIIVLLSFFILGMFSATSYLSIMAIVNNKFHNRALVSANAALQLVGSFSGITGSIMVSLVMSTFPKYGFPMFIISTILIFFLLQSIPKFRKR